MIELDVVEGVLNTINVEARPDRFHTLRVAAVISALISLSCLYGAVFSEPSTAFFSKRRMIIAGVGFGFAAIAVVFSALVLLTA